jgi:hypothetical protein
MTTLAPTTVPDQCTDFSGYTTGNIPSDWSEEWDSGSGTTGEWEVSEALTEKCGTKSLYYNDIDGIAAKTIALSWDDAGDSVGDCEVLALFNLGTPGSNWQAAIVLRGSGSSPGNEDAYIVGLYDGDLWASTLVNGVFSGKDSDNTNFGSGDWVWIRARIDGYRIKAKAWEFGYSEPGPWQVDWTDLGSLYANGWIGLNGNDTDFYCDIFCYDVTAGTVPDPGCLFLFTTIAPTTSPPSPSESPSISPSESPSESPSISPSASPSESPSVSPSESPSVSPSISPSASESPSVSPSESPSLSPSLPQSPSESPSVSPSMSPSASISPSASESPSESPSVSPSPSPTSPPTTVAPTTAAPTPPPTTAAPPVYWVPVVPIGIRAEPIEITVTIHGEAGNQCFTVDPIEITVTVHGSVVEGLMIDAGSIDVEITIYGETILGDYDSHRVMWSKIGHLDFTIDESNLAGERPPDWKGYVYAILKLGDKVVVYGQNGVSVLKASGVHYGMETIYRLGVKNKGAVTGTELMHFFIDVLGQLWILSGEGLIRLDYSEFLYSMSSPVISYDAEKELLYICDGTDGYIYSVRSKSFGEGPVNVTGIGAQGGTLYVVSDGVIDTPKFDICTDIYDFGTRKFKTIQSIEVGSDLTEHLRASVDYRVSYNDSFRQIDWFLVNPNGRAYV